MTDPTKAKCFDKTWKYKPSGSTDLKATFARIRREQREAEAAKPAPANVKPIKKVAK